MKKPTTKALAKAIMEAGISLRTLLNWKKRQRK